MSEVYGVTTEGFSRKRVEDIREELQNDFKSVYGDDLDVSETSNAGAIIDILTKKFAVYWEGQEIIYNTRNINNAEGVTLDNIVQFVGVTRLPATASTVQCECKGDPGTVLTAGRIISQDVTNEEFTLNSNVTLGLTNAIASDIEITTVTDSTVYTITLNGNNYTINSGVGATAVSIMAALKVDVDGGTDPVIFTDNLDGTAVITSDDGVTIFTIAVTANITVNKITSLGQFTAINTGPITVPSNTINTIVTSVSGWDTVVNNQAGVTGNDTETDEELRVRRNVALLSVGAGTDPAIEANILNEVDDVSSVKVFSNRTNGVVDSRPAKSFEAIVTGGDDQEVADKIWQVQPAGIESYGNTTKTVIDSNGDSQTIKFSRPTDKYLWIRYTLTLYTEEDLPTNPEAIITDAVIAFALEEYKPGVDVIRDRLTQPVYQSVSGVGNMTIELAVTNLPTDTPVYGSANIPIADREIAVVNSDRITVLIP